MQINFAVLTKNRLDIGMKMPKTKFKQSFAILAAVTILCAATCSSSFAQSSKKDGSMTKGKAAEKSESVVTLFDGKSLDNFRGYKDDKVGKGWKIDDGALMFDGESGGGDIMTKEQYEDFELSFDWKVDAGANSGVMYRVTTGDNAPYFTGPEYQVLDDTKHHDGKKEITSAGSLYGLYKPSGKSLKKVGQWNSAKIVLHGKKIEHWLNGKKVVEAEVDSEDWTNRVNGSKFKNWKKFGKNAKGHICFQDHGDKVWYRNIKVKSLKK